jgi:hypothetical protein
MKCPPLGVPPSLPTRSGRAGVTPAPRKRRTRWAIADRMELASEPASGSVSANATWHLPALPPTPSQPGSRKGISVNPCVCDFRRNAIDHRALRVGPIQQLELCQASVDRCRLCDGPLRRGGLLIHLHPIVSFRATTAYGGLVRRSVFFNHDHRKRFSDEVPKQ